MKENKENGVARHNGSRGEAPPFQSAPWQPGTVLREGRDRYRIDDLIGRGGHAIVYRATDLRLNKTVALKENTRRSELPSDEQFEEEGKILAGVKHPSLPDVSDVFVEPGEPVNRQCLVMEFVRGKHLADEVGVNGGRLSEAHAVGLMQHILDAAAYLHAQKPPIIHQDIKPSNILVTPEQRAVLVDFGSAKIGGESNKTGMHRAGFTRGYASPEQERGGRTDERSDIYALGATFYYLLAGKNPPPALQLMEGEARLTPLQQLNSALSPALVAVVEKAMALEWAQRFASVVEFKRQLMASRQQPIISPRPPAAPEEKNASGHADAVLPDDLEGFNWGAFLLPWAWGIAHRKWIGLLSLAAYAGSLPLAPNLIVLNWLLFCGGFIIALFLGFKANEWVWRTRRWESHKQFKRARKVWAVWGLAGAPLAFLCFAVVIEGLKPKSAALYSEDGQSFFAQGKFAEAEQEYEKAVELDPSNADYWNELGRARLERKKYPEAEEAYVNAVKLNKAESAYHFNLGLVFERQERLEDAEKEYRRATELTPNDDEFRANRARVLDALNAQRKRGVRQSKPVN